MVRSRAWRRPSAANNVVTATALIPLLSLGIPGSNSAAILLGGFLIHGLIPGPMLFEKHADVVYGLYGGLFMANIAMFLIGLVILSPCIWLVNRPKPYLMAFIFALIVSGVYSIEQSFFDLGIVLAAGVGGYAMRWLGLPFLPMVLGVVLGYLVESNYRRALVISSGDHMAFLQDPISLGLLITSIPALGRFALSRGQAQTQNCARGRHTMNAMLPERAVAEKLAASMRRSPPRHCRRR